MDASTQSRDRRPGFLAELKRRRVLQISAGYVAAAWLGAEVLGFLLEQAGALPGAFRWLAITLVAGFPLAVILAWVVQVQPDGSWAIDRTGTHARTLLGTAVLAAIATGGLSWVLLPEAQPDPEIPVYDPIPNSVAVLPLVEADSTPLQKTIAETLYYTLLDEINRSRDVSQIRLRMKDRPADLLAFGRSVRAGALLDGGVDSIRGGTEINLRLLDVRNGKTIWSAAFDWDATRILELGTEIGNQVFRAMGAPTSHEVPVISPERRTAHELLLIGKRRADSYNSENLQLAIEDAKRAIDLDPSYADAYAYLAKWSASHERYYGGGEDSATMQAEIEKALEKALELDSDSPLAISQLGQYQRDVVEVRRRAQEKALALQPDFALAYFRLAWIAWQHDRDLAEAEMLMRKAVDFDPMNSNFWSDLGSVLVEHDRLNEGVAAIEKSIALDPSASQNYQKLAGVNYYQLGNIDQFVYYMRKGFAIDPARGNLASYAAGGYADLEMKEEALAWVRYGTRNAPRDSESERVCCGPAHAAWATILVHHRYNECSRIKELGAQMIALADRGNGAEFADRHYGECLLRTGDVELAATLLEKPVALDDPQLTCHGRGVSQTFLAIYLNRALDRGKDDSAAFERCLREMEERCAETAYVKPGGRLLPSDSECQNYSDWVALTGDRERTLEALSIKFIDAHHRRWWPVHQGWPWYDFVRDDPEFERIIAQLREEIARQRENVLRMEANGEMPPIPEEATK